MRWILEFLLGAAFWFGLVYVLSEVVQVQPGDRPPPLLFGTFFAIAFGRVMLYSRRPDKNMLAFVICHALAIVVGFGSGIMLYPPAALAG